MAKEAIRKFFTEPQEEQIINAIRQAELNTSGEIRVHIEENCKGDAVDRATQVFGELSMHETELRNGILFYIATEAHKFSVIGDQGIHDHGSLRSRYLDTHTNVLLILLMSQRLNH